MAWTEFGIIRAYLNDDRLDDNLRNYLIASTRMTYALYGVADISVHAGGWGEAEVTDLCTTYFGEAGGSSYGSSVYQMVLKNPGKYAAAAIDYLQITELESTMAANQGENYSEANLLDLLFNQGPANFRVLRSWNWIIKNKTRGQEQGTGTRGIKPSYPVPWLFIYTTFLYLLL